MIKQVILTVDGAYSNRLDEVTSKIKDHQMTIDNVFEFGVILGSIEESQMPSLQEEPFVAELTEDEEVRLPPHDSPQI